jgi:hypothetical protein
LWMERFFLVKSGLFCWPVSHILLILFTVYLKMFLIWEPNVLENVISMLKQPSCKFKSVLDI